MPKPLTAGPGEMPPMLDLTETQLPQIKNWKVGGKYKILVEVEQTGMNNHAYGADKSPLRATFKVLSAKSAGEAPASKSPATVPSREIKSQALKDKADAA